MVQSCRCHTRAGRVLGNQSEKSNGCWTVPERLLSLPLLPLPPGVGNWLSEAAGKISFKWASTSRLQTKVMQCFQLCFWCQISYKNAQGEVSKDVHGGKEMLLRFSSKHPALQTATEESEGTIQRGPCKPNIS